MHCILLNPFEASEIFCFAQTGNCAIGADFSLDLPNLADECKFTGDSGSK